MSSAELSWFQQRGLLLAQPTAVADQLLYEPTVRFFAGARALSSEMSAYSYVAPQIILNRTRVGRYCSIGARCEIGPTQHPSAWLSSSPVSYNDVFGAGLPIAYSHDELSPVTVGHDVWVGTASAIMGGVTIGHGAIIAFGSVVTKDVEPYTIVGGIPARPIRRRFPDALVERLLAFQWWRYDLVRQRGTPIRWDDPERALDDIARKHAAGEIDLLPDAKHRIRRTAEGFAYDRPGSFSS